MAPLPSVNANEVASGRNPSTKEPVSGRASSIWKRLRTLPPRLLALAIGMGILGWVYWPNLQDLYTVWSEEPNYSHGFLVIPIALGIFWLRLTDTRTDWQASRVPWWSWIPLVAVLAARMFAYEHNMQWRETATLVPAVACLMLAMGGWSLLQRGWPAVVFLVFMLPLPPSANNLIALPLQRIATLGSVFVTQLTGLWAIDEGNVITLRDHSGALKTLEVAQACNGLSMLMTLAATVTAIIILFPLANWKRIVVLASAIPIALLSNIVRIVATGWCYYLIDGERAKKIAHDWTGILLMMPLAVILVWLELLLLSWLVDDSPSSDEDIDRPIFPGFPQKANDKIKPRMQSDEL
ncbi:MAG: exosortase/archaeosortase family protein [Isosphaeraceae bacterium]